jgi:hypothetical protein
MAAAAVSIALMVVVLVKYGVRDDPTPETKPSVAPAPSIPGGTPLGNTLPGSAAIDVNDPHQGAKHHTEEAPPDESNQPVPIDVFAAAKVGDWNAFESTIETSLAPKPTLATSVVTLTSVDDKQIVRTTSGEPPKTELMPRRPTLGQLAINNAAAWTIHGVTISDDVREVGGRSFKCKKISFDSRSSEEPARRNHTEMWISDEVPAGGVVEYRVDEGADFKLTRRLVGFGDAKTTRWGKKPAR